MPRASRYGQPEPASYQDIPQTSPDLGYEARSPSSARALQYTQETRYRDSLDAPPRGYGYPDAQPPVGNGYDNPFASREHIPAVPPPPGEFNVEDDFNNVGPRYAEVYGIEREEAEANKPVRPKSSWVDEA